MYKIKTFLLNVASGRSLVVAVHRKMFSSGASIEEKTINIKGQVIKYVLTGSGSNVMLCFPGALGTIWSDFKPQINALDKSKFTVVAWDPPGYGHSRPPNRKFSLSFYEDDATTAFEFMQALNFKKYSLLGWSDGGISSMILSAKYPEIVDKLVVWGANSYVLPEEITAYEKIRDISKWSEKMKQPLIELYGKDGLQNMWNEWVDVLVNISKNGGNICKDLLPKIQCPTLILHGDKDPMVAPEHPQYLLEHIAGSRLHRFPDGKHNIHLRYADEFNNIISKFILDS